MPVVSAGDPAAIAACAQRLADGGLVAFATETVYGLGARADDDRAVAQVFAAKGRPADHPLIVHVASLQAAATFAAFDDGAASRLARAFWPGPVTLIVPRRPGVAAAAAGGQDSVGLRMPSHPAALALLRQAAVLGVPGVAAPSANRFGRVSPTTAAHVVQEFGDALWVLDGGPCEIGIESAIVDCTRHPPTLLRPGQLSRARIEQALGLSLGEPGRDAPRASGTLAAHYAPAAAVRLVTAAEIAALAPPAAAAAARLGVYSRAVPAAAAPCLWRAMPDTPAAVAHELFAVLHDFDAAGVPSIWIEQPPPGADWEGVRDRLQRAAAA